MTDIIAPAFSIGKERRSKHDYNTDIKYVKFAFRSR